MRTEIQELSLGWFLRYLVGRCETRCVSQCCGLRAYDFSPLNIAYYFTDQGEVEMHSEAVKRVEEDILKLCQEAKLLDPNMDGELIAIDQFNTHCTASEIIKFTDEILYNIRVAEQVIKLSENIRSKEKNGKTYNKY